MADSGQQALSEAMPKRLIWEEIALVLALSLLPSLVYSVLNLIETPVIRGTSVALYPQQDLPMVQVLQRFARALFDIAPFWLVLYLIRRGREELSAFGLDTGRLRREIPVGLIAGTALFALGALPYLAAIYLGIQRQVIGAAPSKFWWGLPLFVLGAAGAGLVEEGVMIGYLIPRLLRTGMAPRWTVIASAAFRGGYHLYQGWGGLIGNFIFGLFFGVVYLRYKRTWPLVIAHFWIDVLAGFATWFVTGRCLLGTCF